MKKISYLLLAVIVVFTACKAKYKKTKDGIEYKIIAASNKGAEAVKGNFLEVEMNVMYKDSVLFSSREAGMPQYIDYNPDAFPPAFQEVFKKLSIGDSIIIKVSVDTLIEKGQAAPFMKKGEFLMQYFKVENIFTTVEQRDSAQKSHVAVAKARAYEKTIVAIEKDLLENKSQLEQDDKALTAYMTKNNLIGGKTKWGTYVAIKDTGVGANITNANVAVVNYTGKTLNDSTFDSNTDPSFKHVEPFSVDMSQFRVIPGWIDGLKMFKKGGKGTIVIPSSLAYGKNGKAPTIAPNENLVFNIEVIDVISVEQYEEAERQKQKIQMEIQKQMMEQMQKQKAQGGEGTPPPANK